MVSCKGVEYYRHVWKNTKDMYVYTEYHTYVHRMPNSNTECQIHVHRISNIIYAECQNKNGMPNTIITLPTVIPLEEIIPLYVEMGLHQPSVVEVRGSQIFGVPDDVDYLHPLLPDLGRQELARQVRLDQAGKISRHPADHFVSLWELRNKAGERATRKFFGMQEVIYSNRPAVWFKRTLKCTLISVTSQEESPVNTLQK